MKHGWIMQVPVPRLCCVGCGVRQSWLVATGLCKWTCYSGKVVWDQAKLLDFADFHLPVCSSLVPFHYGPEEERHICIQQILVGWTGLRRILHRSPMPKPNVNCHRPL